MSLPLRAGTSNKCTVSSVILSAIVNVKAEFCKIVYDKMLRRLLFFFYTIHMAMNKCSLRNAIGETDRYWMNLCKYDVVLVVFIIRLLLKAEFKELLYESLFYVELNFLYFLLLYFKCSILLK